MLRTVTSHLSIDVRQPLELLLAVAVADGAHDRSEQLAVRHEDGPLDVVEIKGPHGGRTHRVAVGVSVTSWFGSPLAASAHGVVEAGMLVRRCTCRPFDRFDS